MARTDRFTFHLSREVNARLIQGRAQDRIPAARRLRAGIQLWHEDPLFRAKVDQAAPGLRAPRGGRSEHDATVKLDVSLDRDVHASLARARGDDRLCAADRIRAVVHLWEQDPDSRELIDARAVAMGVARSSPVSDQ